MKSLPRKEELPIEAMMEKMDHVAFPKNVLKKIWEKKWKLMTLFGNLAPSHDLPNLENQLFYLLSALLQKIFLEILIAAIWFEKWSWFFRGIEFESQKKVITMAQISISPFLAYHHCKPIKSGKCLSTALRVRVRSQSSEQYMKEFQSKVLAWHL